MKKILSILLVSIFTLTLVSCNSDNGGSGVDKDGNTTITFFGWGSAEEQANYQKLIEEFMVINQDIKVSYTAVSSDQYMRTLKNRINNLPDVFYMPDTEFMQWADSGRLLALDEYVTDQELSEVWDLASTHYRYDRSKYKLGEGDLYGLAKDVGPFSMVMNKTLFREVLVAKGLNAEDHMPDKDIPMTWDEFANLAKLVTTKDVYGVTHYELAAAVYSNNADFIKDNGTKQAITDPNFIDAVQYIADLDLVHGAMPNTNEQASINGFQRFVSAGAVFSFMGPWDLAGFWNTVGFEFDLVPIPVGPAAGAKSTAWLGSMGISVSAKTKQKEASVKLAKFLTMSETSQRLTYELGQAVPNIKSLAKGDFLNNVNLEGKKALPANKEMFIKMIEGTDLIAGKPRVQYYTYENVWYDDFMMELVKIYTGQMTSRDFMNSYASKLQQGLDDSNSYLN